MNIAFYDTLDTKYVITGDKQGHVIVWNRVSGERLSNFRLPQGQVAEAPRKDTVTSKEENADTDTDSVMAPGIVGVTRLLAANGRIFASSQSTNGGRIYIYHFEVRVSRDTT